MGALDAIVRQGKALYAGISNYPAELTAKAAGILRELGTPLLIHQPSYSILNRWTETDGLYDATEREGVGVIVFSPLHRGLLSGRYLQGIAKGSRADWDRVFVKPEWINAETIAAMRALEEIARRRGQTSAQMALAWVLRDSRVTSALFGASSVDQIRDNLGALKNLTFDADELAAIDEAARPLAKALGF